MTLHFGRSTCLLLRLQPILWLSPLYGIPCQSRLQCEVRGVLGKKLSGGATKIVLTRSLLLAHLSSAGTLGDKCGVVPCCSSYSQYLWTKDKAASVCRSQTSKDSTLDGYIQNSFKQSSWHLKSWICSTIDHRSRPSLISVAPCFPGWSCTFLSIWDKMTFPLFQQ